MGIRFFLSILFTIVISTISWGQHYVDVLLRPQLQTKWCWAACIEMIHKFHDNTSTITQCDIACKHEYFKQVGPLFGSPLPPYVNCCTDCTVPGTILSGVLSTCNQTILFSKRVAKPRINYFGILNSFYGYSSIEDIEINKLTWPRITEEIQQCRPFVLYLNKSTLAHLVVAEGTYVTSGANGTQHVLVNDSQSSSEYLIPFTAMTDPLIQLNSVFQIARGIFPKDAEECKTCDKLKPIDEHPLIKDLLKNANLDLYFGLTKTIFTQVQYNALLEKSSGPLKYYYENTFSYENLKGDEALRCKVLVAKEAKPQIATTFQKVGSDYLVKEIALQASTPFASAIKLFNAANKSFPFSNTEFEIIQFVPDGYQFYKVRMDGVSYLSPANIYPDIPFKQYYMYKESDVRKELAKMDAEVKDVIKKQEKTLSKELKRLNSSSLQKTNE